MNSVLTVPVQITPIDSKRLHEYWPFLERGLKDICRKVHPDNLPEDVYGAIRAEAATACLVTRGARWLGFFVWHRQERPWSHKLDIFVWATWALPLRERLPTDDIPGAFYASLNYLLDLKRSLAAERVTAVTSRRGLIKRYGFKELFITLEI